MTGDVELSGPFFQRDPGLTLRGNVRKMMAALAEEGEREAIAAYRQGSTGRAQVSRLGGRVADRIVGRIHARPSKGGKEWRASAVIQVYNEGLSAADSMSLMAAAARVERQTRGFRSLYRSVRNARAVMAADLTKGLE